MTSDARGSDLKASDLHHHTGGGRNVVEGAQGIGGQDVFHAAVEMSRMPMILTDPYTDDNPIVFCNRAFEMLTGYAQDEIIGRNCRFLQGPNTDPATVARIRESVQANRDVHEDIFNYRKDGTGFWNALYISPVVGPDGRLIYFFASQLDVTRRHEAEAVIEQAKRLETLGSMASSIAHEFNNLMTVVLGSLSQVERGLPEDGKDRQRLERASWGARQAGRLTQQMLSFARRQFHDNQVVDLNQVLSGFDDVLRQMTGPRIALTLALDGAPAPAFLDAGQLEMAVLNLVRNAADAMPEEGTLVVGTGRGAEDGTDWVEVTVRDSGTGMSEEVARRATEPFFTTKRNGSGTGLGLSMVSGFVAQSNGQLVITSRPGDGTTVSLRFPAQ